jgi:hypothetical protein
MADPPPYVVKYSFSPEDPMKRVLLSAGLMLLFATGVGHGASLLGPAGPGGSGYEPEGGRKFSVGLGYFYYDDYWKNGGRLKLRENQTFLEGSWRPVPGAEVFARLGGTDLRLQNTLDFKDNYNFYSGLGARAVFYKFGPKFDLGGTLYVDSSWSDYRHRDIGADGSFTDARVRSPWSANLAVLGEWTPAASFVMYGGPKFFYGASKEEIRFISAGGAAGESSRSIRTEYPIGGVLGARFAIMGIERLRLGLELQFTTRVSVGGTAGYSF